MLITKQSGICFFLTLLCSITVFGQNDAYVPNQLIIKFKSVQTRDILSLQSRMNATTIKTFPHLGALQSKHALSLQGAELWEVCDNGKNCIEDLIREYHNHPSIEYIEPNYYAYASNVSTTTPIDPGFDGQWNFNNTGQSLGLPDADIDAPEGWAINNDCGNIVVAIIDSGIDWTHEDLIDNIWQNLGEDADGDGHVIEWDTATGSWGFDPGDENGIDDDDNGYPDDFIGWDFVNDDNNPYDDAANGGHGTHVAGIVGASGNNNIGITGACWNVQLAALKFLKYDRSGTTAHAAEALRYAIAKGMPISNNSWRSSGDNQMMKEALELARDNQHLFIASAGNGSLNDGQAINIDYRAAFPASYNYDNIITVAALDRHDALWFSSNFGLTSVDIGAPGVEI